MPKEHLKRGRREERKRKREECSPIDNDGAIRQRPRNTEQDQDVLAENVNHGFRYGIDERPRPGDLPFYGLLDEQEHEYFKRADLMLETHQFADAEEKDLFLANVYREANGKELKIANSQSCSRLMERLILLSSSDQLKTIFQKFRGHFLNLVQHRFASHCCEALFLQAAPIVSFELTAPLTEDGEQANESMETLCLSVVNELEPQLGYLLSDTFASHPLRVLLLVLSGMPLTASGVTVTLQSRKKENISIASRFVPNEEENMSRTVPSSFQSAVDMILASILTGLDTTALQALATQPTTNPVLQILLQLELSRSGKQSTKRSDSLLFKLIPDDPLVEGTQSAIFIQHLLYDPVGSRLLEVIVSHAPGKTFKALYRNLLRGRLGKITRNETAAFVIIKLIDRLGKDDLQTAIGQICSCIDILIARSRTAVIKALIERSRAREVDTQPIADALQQCGDNGAAPKLIEMLQIGADPAEGMSADRKKQFEGHDVGRTHASLLAQTMLEAPGPLRDLINNALLSAETTELKMIAGDRSASRVLQAALTCSEQSIGFRRLFIQRLLSSIIDLATNTVASHVVDALWEGSSGLKFLRERVADEMLENESILRESIPGRAVWRNWRMDLYKGRRREWSDASTGEKQSTKTGIELARERHAVRKINRHSKS